MCCSYNRTGLFSFSSTLAFGMSSQSFDSNNSKSILEFQHLSYWLRRIYGPFPPFYWPLKPIVANVWHIFIDLLITENLPLKELSGWHCRVWEAYWQSWECCPGKSAVQVIQISLCVSDYSDHSHFSSQLCSMIIGLLMFSREIKHA